MDKKGQGISMTYIIIAALALVVLVVIIMFFTGGLQKLFGQQTDIVGGSTDQQYEIWRGQCKLYCSLGQQESWEKHVFDESQPDLHCKDIKLMGGDWDTKCKNVKKEPGWDGGDQ